MALYYLAVNPLAQEKAAREAQEVAERAGESGKISGEDFNELKFIDNCPNHNSPNTSYQIILVFISKPM